MITGLGVVDPPPREQMFNLELAQRWLVNSELQEIVPDPDAHGELETCRPAAGSWTPSSRTQAPRIALRKHVAQPLSGADRRLREVDTARTAVWYRTCRGVQRSAGGATAPYRRLRVYAVDPSLSTRLDDRRTPTK